MADDIEEEYTEPQFEVGDILHSIEGVACKVISVLPSPNIEMAEHEYVVEWEDTGDVDTYDETFFKEGQMF